MRRSMTAPTWVWVVAVLVGAVWSTAWTTASWADRGAYGHHKQPDAATFIWHLLGAKAALGLSDEQEARLRALAVNFKKDNVKRSAEVELAEIDLHTLLHDDTVQGDSSKVEAAVRKMYALKADRRLASIKAFQEARSVLTPEQQTKLRELRHDRHRPRGPMEGSHSMESGEPTEHPDDLRHADAH